MSDLSHWRVWLDSREFSERFVKYSLETTGRSLTENVYINTPSSSVFIICNR